MIALQAAVLAARPWSIGFPRWPATTVKYSEAPVAYTCEMWHSTSAGVPDSASAVVSASVTAVFSAGILDQSVGVSSVSQRAPAGRQAARKQRVAQARRPDPAVLPGPSRGFAQRRAAQSCDELPGFGVPAFGMRR